MADGNTRELPKLLHLRQPKGARPSHPPASAVVPSSDDLSARAVPLDVVRRELQSGALPPDTEVLFTGLGDWTPAREVPELWIAAPPPPPNADADAADSAEIAPSIPPSKLAAEPKRKGFGALAIVGAIGGAIVFLALGAAAVFFAYFYYKPVAIRHLPKKCTVAARVDFIDWAFFHPFMDKIPPAIEDATKPKVPPVGPPQPSLKEKLLAQAGINLDRDVREVAMCVFPDTSPVAAGAPPDPLHGFRAVIALGGRLKKGAIPGIYESIRGESFGSALRLDGTGDAAVIRLAPPVGGVIGQAEDGTLIFAPDDKTLAQAREGTTEEDAEADTGLVKKGGFEIVLGHVLFAGFATVPPTTEFDAGTLDALSKIQSGHFSVVLDKNPHLEANLESRGDADAKATEAALRHLLDVANTELASTKADYSGEHAAMQGAKVSRDDTRVDVRIDFAYGDVDRGAQTLADQIKDETSPLRSKTIPLFLFEIGAGPVPPFMAKPSPSSSASGAPSGVPTVPPSYDEE